MSRAKLITPTRAERIAYEQRNKARLYAFVVVNGSRVPVSEEERKSGALDKLIGAGGKAAEVAP